VPIHLSSLPLPYALPYSHSGADTHPDSTTNADADPGACPWMQVPPRSTRGRLHLFRSERADAGEDGE